ncbi:MAG: hypothetical protein QNJ77_09950 [Acidimicrobiia bacterium]|nr:hypothetical protein [Acidimicrobiia bacterium]
MGAIAVVVVVVIVLLFVAMRMVGSNDPFQRAAVGLGLKFTRSVPELFPRLEGMINGLPVRIDTPENRAPGVRYRVFYPPLGMALRLERETTITRTLGELGQQDTQVGEKTFDNSFKVNTSRPDALREMMTPELRRTLVKLIKDHPQILIEDGGMTLTTDSPDVTAETIVATTIAMAAAAHQLVSNRPPPLEKPPPVRPPTPQPAPPRSQQPAAPRPGSKAADGEEPATERRESAAPEAPAPAPQPPPASSPPIPVATPPPTGLPDGFFDAVFGESRLSFEDEGEFDERFRGTEVTLAGNVKQAREVDEDSTVSVGPSTKAVVTVAQIDTDLYGKTDIDAIVFLPAGSAANLERGKQISFTGKLEKVDPFMRNLFVTGARQRSG